MEPQIGVKYVEERINYSNHVFQDLFFFFLILRFYFFLQLWLHPSRTGHRGETVHDVSP